MPENFALHIKQKGEECSVILKELNNIQYYKLQGRPKFSNILIRFALTLRYSSYQTYKLLLKELPLPSLSILKKLASGEVDSLKVAKLLPKKQTVSNDCVLIIDEMYLQKSVQYHSGDFVGQDDEGNLFKGIVLFMVVSLKKSNPIVIPSLPETKITDKWLKCEINKCILDLAEVGFKVRAVITDHHPSNVNAFTRLHEMFDGGNKTFIKHPAHADFATKTYLFFDVVHLFKNIRNNLLN